MDLNEYQKRAGATAVYPNQGEFLGLVYVALKGAGEAGEFAEKVGKAMRDDNLTLTDKRRHDLIIELGDRLWYVQQAATELGVTLTEVAELNLAKLVSRHERGKIHGEGDNR